MIGEIFQGIGASIQGIGQMVMAHANVKVAKEAGKAQAAHDVAALEYIKWSPAGITTDLYSRTNNSSSIYVAIAAIAFVIIVIVIFNSIAGSGGKTPSKSNTGTT